MLSIVDEQSDSKNHIFFGTREIRARTAKE
jgi:hypothetical protein